MKLYDSAGILVTSATTGANGEYSFTGLPPDAYTVEFVLLASYELSPQGQGSNPAADSDANQFTGRTAPVVLASGETTSDVDAGAYLPATISNFVWEDKNGNGIQDDWRAGRRECVGQPLRCRGQPGVHDLHGRERQLQLRRGAGHIHGRLHATGRLRNRPGGPGR